MLFCPLSFATPRDTFYTSFRPWSGSLYLYLCRVRKLPGRGVLPSGGAELWRCAITSHPVSGHSLRGLLLKNRSQLGKEERVSLRAGPRLMAQLSGDLALHFSANA